MRTVQESKRRIISVALLAWFAVIGVDFFLHGGLFANLYAEPSPFLLSPEKAFRLIPLGYLALLIFVIFLVWLVLQLRITDWRSGLVFGLQAGAFVGSALALGLLSITTSDVTRQPG